MQNWFWWGSVRHDRFTHGRWEESPGNLYLRLLKVSHENVNNTGLQGQPRSAVRSLCLIFAAGISASHEMSQSQSHVFNPLELSLLLLFRRSPDERLTLPLFLVFIVFDTGICLMQFLLHQALILGALFGSLTFWNVHLHTCLVWHYSFCFVPTLIFIVFLSYEYWTIFFYCYKWCLTYDTRPIQSVFIVPTFYKSPKV